MRSKPFIRLSRSKFARPGLPNPGQNGDLAIPFEQKLDVLRLHFVVTLSLAMLAVSLFILRHSPILAAGNELQQPVLSCDDPIDLSQSDLPGQYYGQSVPLLENQGASTIELLSAYAGYTNTLEKSLDSFSILKEGETYYLWLTSRLRVGSLSPVTSIEQRSESKNGLVWCNRTNTNLTRNDTYKFFYGPRNIIKNGSLYEGWDEYYYEWSSGWGYALRYITSTNGITWTVVNEPALIGTVYANVIKEGGTYQMWAVPHGDSNYQGTRSLRYRTSASGGTGWGHWQTGGTLVNVDGGEVGNLTRVRRLPDGTYQLFYWQGDYIHLAASTDGITFTTQITNLLNLTKTLPITDVNGLLSDFAVVDVEGEDWFYINYCTAVSASGHCISSHIAVSRPIHRTELALAKSVTPTMVNPGDPITYTLTFSNTGQDTATGLIITDILPSTLLNPVVNSNLTITDTGYSPHYVWRVQNLAPGANGTITITGQVSPTLSNGVSFTNTSTIATTAVEIDTTNNTDTAIVTATSIPNCVSVPSGLVSWWPGDGNATDIIGGNHGTLLNGTKFAPGLVGQAFSFDGENDIVHTPLIVSYTDGVTFDAWVRTTDDAGLVVSDGGGVSDEFGMGLFIEPGGTIDLFGTKGTDGDNNFRVIGPVISDGGFHLVAATWTGDTTPDGAKLYVNGTLVGRLARE